MRRHYFAMLLTGCLFVSGARAADAAKEIEGDWVVSYAEAGGEEINSEEIKSVKLGISGGFYTVTTASNADAGAITLDTSKNPKAMDLIPATGPNAGKIIPAIYEVNGQTMRACYALDGGVRPTEFKTRPDSPILLILFKRAGPAADADGFVPMFNGKDLSGWVPINVGPNTFTVSDGMIVCTGKPTGIMRTERHYENFIVELEWRHMVPKGNSGFFVWADPIGAVGSPYTRGVEVQVLDGPNGDWYTTHGDVFPIWGAKMKPDHGRGGDRAFPTEERSKPSPQWNHYRVECRDGNVSLAVNGKVVTTGREATPRKGYLCLESEGGVVHFRNIKIKELPPSSGLDPKDVAKLDEGFRSVYTGLDFSGWKADGPVGEHWKVSDYTFGYDGAGDEKSRTLWLDRALGNYELVLDYRTEAAEPIVLLPRGEGGPAVEFGLATPGAAKAGEWNRVTARLHGGKITVKLNGQTVREDQPLAPAAGQGPLGLRAQAKASFANVYVKSLE